MGIIGINLASNLFRATPGGCQAATTVQAALLARSHLGTPLTTLFELMMDLYVQLGYPEERYNHFHGGPVGYWAGYAERMRDPDELMKPNMAFLYYLTIAGVDCEELMLVDEQKAEYVSIDPDWPMLGIPFEGIHWPTAVGVVRCCQLLYFPRCNTIT